MLYHAVSRGQTEIVQMLLAKNEMKIEKKPQGGYTFPYRAVKGGNTDSARLLLDPGAKTECTAPGGPSALF